MSLGRVSSCSGSGVVGKFALAMALCLFWLAGTPVGSWALLVPAQTAEPAVVPVPGSPLPVGVDSAPGYGTQALPPMALSAFPWGEGLARIGLMSDDTRPNADGPWKAAPGVTAAPSAHGLLLNLGPRTTLKAGLTQQPEEQSRAPDERTQERTLEFATAFGAEGKSGLRLAMTSVETVRGNESSGTRAAEAHLNLAPTARLNINADYVTKDSGNGERVTTESLRTAVHLAPEAELSASLKRVDPSGASAASESGPALSVALGCGKLKGEETWASTGEGRIASRKWAFAGGFGQGPARTSVKLDLRESRGERPEDQSRREMFVRVDRALGPRLTLAAEYGEDSTGRRASLSRRRLSLGHQWKAVRLNLEERSWQEGTQERSLVTWSVDAPAGELPEWARAIPVGHRFPDVKEYLLGEGPVWDRVETPFAGIRLWASRRDGGADDGTSSLGLAHGQVVAGRLHLQIAIEQRPEAEEGIMKGRPLPVRRSVAEIGGRLFRSLHARCGYGLETGLDSPNDRLKRARFGIGGKLAEDEQVEGVVSHEWGRREGEGLSRTRLALLYSHRVDEERRVEAKVGYAWGAGAEPGIGRDCRLTLGYVKPL